MEWIDANGVSLRYELAGRGVQTVLLIHELGGALDSFDESVPAFQRHFRTLRYDQRGCGHSEKVRGTCTINDMVADLFALLERLSIDRPCHVAGAALGASIALAFAAIHPSRVARLLVMSPATCSNPALHSRIGERAAAVEREGMRFHAEKSLSRSYPDILRGNRARYEKYRGSWIANDPLGFAAFNRMLMDMDITPELPKITCPTLVIGCTYDINRPPAESKMVAQAIPEARYLEAESGHFMPVQTPELFVQHALAFFREQ